MVVIVINRNVKVEVASSSVAFNGYPGNGAPKKSAVNGGNDYIPESWSYRLNGPEDKQTDKNVKIIKTKNEWHLLLDHRL